MQRLRHYANTGEVRRCNNLIVNDLSFSYRFCFGVDPQFLVESLGIVHDDRAFRRLPLLMHSWNGIAEPIRRCGR
jgi:hypothetical protein